MHGVRDKLGWERVGEMGGDTVRSSCQLYRRQQRYVHIRVCHEMKTIRASDSTGILTSNRDSTRPSVTTNERQRQMARVKNVRQIPSHI